MDLDYEKELLYAVDTGNEKLILLCLKYIEPDLIEQIDSSSDLWKICMDIACKRQLIEIMDAIIKKGYDPQDFHLLTTCVCYSVYFSFKFLIEHNAVITQDNFDRILEFLLTFYCFDAKKIQMVLILLKLPFDVSVRFWNIIILKGCWYNNLMLVKLAVSNRTSPNMGLTIPGTSKDIILYLIEQGGDINYRNDLNETDVEYLVKRKIVKKFGEYNELAKYIKNKIDTIKTMTDILLPEILNICGDY